MSEAPKYVVVGRGRWAPRMRAILEAEHRAVSALERARRAGSESDSAYLSRLQQAFCASAAQIAWLCVPPGSHLPTLISAALDAGLHVLVEKPWLCSQEETAHLEALAKARGLLVAIHYEYCVMSAVEQWRRDWRSVSGLAFSAVFATQRADHIGLPALDNLGSHLFSIHEYCVPDSAVAAIHCAYRAHDERRVWLTQNSKQVAGIDLLANSEPIIQRFLARLEAALQEGNFSFDLQFALRVAHRTAAWRRAQIADS